MDNARPESVKLTLLYMKKSPLPTVLMAILAISVLMSLYLCYTCVTNASELSQLQNQAAMVNNNRAIMNAVATDAVEYSKTHPAIDPLLEEAKLKAPSHPQASAKPSK